MISEPVPPEPIPSYFLQEASELLQQMDQELQTLRQDFSIAKVHTLMRVAHTLKGAAASVGLDAIKTTTHSLEDAFKALCAPDASLSVAVEDLIFDAYACLQLLLSARFTNTPLDESAILDRMAGIVSQLQENLGDQFGNDGYLPTSTELGFDMTQSIFEIGVTERLTELEKALQHPEPEILTPLLQSQADIFFGLAESLSLPGFGAIAQCTLAALNAHPHQVVKIAQAALADYRAGQASVLQGDRTQGGNPGPVLQKLSGKLNHPPNRTQASEHQPIPKTNNVKQTNKQGNWFGQLWQQLNRPIPGTPQVFTDRSNPPSVKQPLDSSKSQPAPSSKVTQPPLTVPETIPEILPETNITAPLVEIPTADFTGELADIPEPLEALSLVDSKQESLDSDKTTLSTDSATLRVSVKYIERLNYAIGELLTQQNRQLRYHEKLSSNLKNLSNRILKQQRQLSELQQQAIQDSSALALHVSQSNTLSQQFDSLELDQYGSLHPLVQPALDNMIQQLESVEALDLFTRQSYETLEKQRRLVDNLRNTLFDIRMYPLEGVLQRFNQVLTRLSTQSEKSANLNIQGGKLRVDKAIVDKLYDPLLHLVRNSFAHGIETSTIRQQYNKPAYGTITLEASQKGRYLTIKVNDDGQGINLDKVRQIALDNQIIDPQKAPNLTPEQLRNLIFEPGFSTANQIDDLSGRGMGLNAVRSQVEALSGSITVTSKTNQWTCFTLKIPTNLTIAKLLICQASNKQYAIMTDTVQQIVIPTAKQISTREHVKFLSWKFDGKDFLVPVVSLSEALNYQAILPDNVLNKTDISSKISLANSLKPIILIQTNDQIVGLEVESLEEEQELVINPLGKMLSVASYIYGCSTLNDGSLSLVLDGAVLVQHILNNLSQSVLDIVKANEKISLESSTASSVVAPTKKSILIVDDSITVRNTLATTLQKAGYKVVHAKEGAEALQKLDQMHVDAILCDLEMPGMNGFDFLKARQSIPAINAIPTIMLTSRAGSKHRALAQDLGAVDYLTKPYLTPQLLEKLANVLDHSSEAQQLETVNN